MIAIIELSALLLFCTCVPAAVPSTQHSDDVSPRITGSTRSWGRYAARLPLMPRLHSGDDSVTDGPLEASQGHASSPSHSASSSSAAVSNHANKLENDKRHSPHHQPMSTGETVSEITGSSSSAESKTVEFSIGKAEALRGQGATPQALQNEEQDGKLGMMMQMVFYGGSEMSLWFKGFKVDTTGEWVASCLGLTLLAALYEGLKAWRIILANRYESTGYRSIGHGIQSLLHLVQVSTSYFLMLAVMTYSSWVMISVCAGAALGYFVFAKFVPAGSLLGNISEHCH